MPGIGGPVTGVGVGVEVGTGVGVGVGDGRFVTVIDTLSRTELSAVRFRLTTVVPTLQPIRSSLPSPVADSLIVRPSNDSAVTHVSTGVT